MTSHVLARAATRAQFFGLTAGHQLSDLHRAVRTAYRDAFPARLDTIIPATEVGAVLLREALAALGRRA